MSNLETRILLQQSRFHLIEHAADTGYENDASKMTRPYINTRLEVLEQNWIRFQEEHESLCHTAGEQLSEHSYMRSRVFERCQEFYVHARAQLITYRDEIDPSVPQSRSALSDLGASGSVSHRSALPRITLPHFSGDYQSWRSFHDLFTSIIRENADLTNVERMHYLKTSLSGEASRLVSNLSVSGDNFEIAWETLVSRYENKRFLISAQLDRLINLKPIKVKSAQGLSTFLVTATESLGALRALGCAVHSWDPLLLHLLVKLLDSESREAWEVRLGSSTELPTFSQFEEFLVGRTRALENLALHPVASTSNKERSSSSVGFHRSRASSHVTATSTAAGSPVCPLCKSAHYMTNCSKYQSKTAQQRREIVVAHRRCFNCLGSHAVPQCRSTKRCQKCGKKHHTSLHSFNTGVTQFSSPSGSEKDKHQLLAKEQQPSTSSD